MKNIILSLTLLMASSGAFAENVKVQRDTIPIGDEEDVAFQSDMHQKFRDMFNMLFTHAFNQTDPAINGNKAFMPIRSVGSFESSEMRETKDNIFITIDMPGAKKEAMDVQIAPRAVTISYQQKEETSSKDDKASISERRYSAFQRQYSLPDYAVIDKAEAQYKDGVLNITIPKDEKAIVKPRKLEIK